MIYCPMCLGYDDREGAIKTCDSCYINFKYNVHTDFNDVIYIPGWNRKGRIKKSNFEEEKDE